MKFEQHFKVEQLNARYAEAIDAGRLEEWPNFFDESGRYTVTTAENLERGLPLCLIYATSRAMLRDRVRSLRDANIYEAQRYRHIVGVPLIEPVENGTVLAQTSFIVVRIMHAGDSMLFASGRYRDRIAIDDKQSSPRFIERAVILDSRQLDTLLAIPI